LKYLLKANDRFTLAQSPRVELAGETV